MLQQRMTSDVQHHKLKPLLVPGKHQKLVRPDIVSWHLIEGPSYLAPLSSTILTGHCRTLGSGVTDQADSLQSNTTYLIPTINHQEHPLFCSYPLLPHLLALHLLTPSQSPCFVIVPKKIECNT